jgi:hypothetical protein
VSLAAIQHVRRMRGGAQAHLMRCSDGQYYVVKFMNNPQHVRVLANEMLASHLVQICWIARSMQLGCGCERFAGCTNGGFDGATRRQNDSLLARPAILSPDIW